MFTWFKKKIPEEAETKPIHPKILELVELITYEKLAEKGDSINEDGSKGNYGKGVFAINDINVNYNYSNYSDVTYHTVRDIEISYKGTVIPIEPEEWQLIKSKILDVRTAGKKAERETKRRLLSHIEKQKHKPFPKDYINQM